ncbi:hypothetical protein LVJ82_17170 [Vitreoscilla massiliensis]|uniref:Uncharacterized protein n=1 Tax=Vitreoscilla massiliensis TaxID=1689272 RepID=A0ABY4E1D7_9NEIS|nr:hypothetical protein [Vitreoscilla massiliensis]UOO89151.1 hypothetical protein LVJ82_17170 [Vitreoscilla massiliensis]
MNSRPIEWLIPELPTRDHLISIEILMGIVEEAADEPGFFQEYLRLFGEKPMPTPARTPVDVLINNSVIEALVREYGSGFIKFVYHSIYLTMPNNAFNFKRQLLIKDDWTTLGESNVSKKL